MLFQKKPGSLPGPKDIPELVGRSLVVDEKQSPDSVWTLKGVIRPTGNKRVFYCRVFDQNKVAAAGVKVKDWLSLDGHPELILWEGHYDKEKNTAKRGEFTESAAA